jgi:hypothetical protein
LFLGPECTVKKITNNSREGKDTHVLWGTSDISYHPGETSRNIFTQQCRLASDHHKQ